MGRVVVEGGKGAKGGIIESLLPAIRFKSATWKGVWLALVCEGPSDYVTAGSS